MIRLTEFAPAVADVVVAAVADVVAAVADVVVTVVDVNPFL